MKSVHVVCVGNICRSPLLEEILRAKAKEFGLQHLTFSSSGLSDSHAGEGADPRMMRVASERGYSLEHHQAKQFETENFVKHDLILAANRDILEELLLFRDLSDGKAKLLLATSLSPLYCDQDIPDPYYGGEDGFNQVVDFCEDAADGLLKWLSSTKSSS